MRTSVGLCMNQISPWILLEEIQRNHAFFSLVALTSLKISHYRISWQLPQVCMSPPLSAASLLLGRQGLLTAFAKTALCVWLWRVPVQGTCWCWCASEKVWCVVLRQEPVWDPCVETWGHQQVPMALPLLKLCAGAQPRWVPWQDRSSPGCRSALLLRSWGFRQRLEVMP